MRPSFEKNLKEFSKLAKDQINAEEAEELEKLQTVIDYHLERAAKNQETPKGKQEEVFDIQKEKQLVMEYLYENLKCLDDEDCTQEKMPESRLVTFDNKKNNFLVEMEDGSQEEATLGDVLTDGDWGLVYYLDPKTVSRTAQKKFFVESAKRELRDLLDRQIVTNEMASSHINANTKSGLNVAFSGYQKLKELEKNRGIIGQDNSYLLGWIAEISVKNFFQQLYINGLTNFRIIGADILQDIEEKIDFIIHIEKYKRGIGVVVDDKISNIGIQFTIGRSKIGKKKKQIRNVKRELIESGIVDDIVVVKFVMKFLRDYYNEWVEDNMPPGGPLQYSTISLRKKLFYRILEQTLRGVLKNEEINELWQEIEPGLQFRVKN